MFLFLQVTPPSSFPFRTWRPYAFCPFPFFLVSAMTQDLFAGRLNAQRVGVLDGGFATFMEDALGLEMPSPLWSATLLDPQHRQGTWQGHDAVRAAHKAFIQSGSRVVETASYQASVPSFARSQPPNPTYAPAVAEGLMRASIRLAVEAADAAHQEGGPNAMVAISLGPYGAMLEGGRECMLHGLPDSIFCIPFPHHEAWCRCRHDLLYLPFFVLFLFCTCLFHMNRYGRVRGCRARGQSRGTSTGPR